MATTTLNTHCFICNKKKATFKCTGCLEEFCYKHLTDHRQELNKQLNDIEMNHNLLRQTLNQNIENPNNHFLIQKIDQWEQDSMKKIQETAKQARDILLK